MDQSGPLLEPYRYLSEIPGKEVRSLLIASFNKWLEIEPANMREIKQIIGMLHNASLLIDDIEDNSKMRRGVPVAHSIFGVASTINCANYVYFLAMEKCMQFGSPQVTQIFLEELISLHRGQGMDIYWRDNNKCPSEEEYSDMVLKKTGGLFRLAVRLMQAFSKSSVDYVPLVNQLGLYFQIRDDYINLASTEYMANKSFCEDLTEGKFSFPIIHAIKANPDDRRLLSILSQHTESVELKQHAVEYMRKMKSFDYTKDVLDKLKDELNVTIQNLGGNVELVAMLEELHTKMN
eukprot:TRINITY_DN788_c0_g1_i1.p1 TRINITY_DN788_c0_g1~~TRINITY_DN788_c0_g1_i1.p1  ORF type:complete len:292 (-),score=54.27 TRINITY_DN788_c0_g1_i1:2088-2963(-)